MLSAFLHVSQLLCNKSNATTINHRFVSFSQCHHVGTVHYWSAILLSSPPAHLLTYSQTQLFHIYFRIMTATSRCVAEEPPSSEKRRHYCRWALWWRLWWHRPSSWPSFWAKKTREGEGATKIPKSTEAPYPYSINTFALARLNLVSFKPPAAGVLRNAWMERVPTLWIPQLWSDPTIPLGLGGSTSRMPGNLPTTIYE